MSCFEAWWTRMEWNITVLPNTLYIPGVYGMGFVLGVPRIYNFMNSPCMSLLIGLPKWPSANLFHISRSLCSLEAINLQIINFILLVWSSPLVRAADDPHEFQSMREPYYRLFSLAHIFTNHSSYGPQNSYYGPSRCWLVLSHSKNKCCYFNTKINTFWLHFSNMFKHLYALK